MIWWRQRPLSSLARRGYLEELYRPVKIYCPLAPTKLSTNDMGEGMQIEPIQMTQTTALDATVSEVDLNRLRDDEWAVIEAAWYEHAIGFRTST